MLAACGMVVLTAAPALAHGSSGPDATNFISNIDRVSGEGDASALEGVAWAILGNDAMVQVENRTAEELLVEGYSGEPYLRIGPDGVFENKHSPAAYLNSDRFASVEVPKEAAAEAEPEWERVSDESTYSWHDHRAHWMSADLPPQVADSDAGVVNVFDWSIPFSLDSMTFAVEGNLKWVRPGPVWPWLLGVMAVISLPLLAALRQPSGPRRKAAVSRIFAGVLGVVTTLNVVHSVDDIRALPATVWENAGAVLQSAFFIGLAIAGIYSVWRTRNSPWGAWCWPPDPSVSGSE